MNASFGGNADTMVVSHAEGLVEAESTNVLLFVAQFIVQSD